MTLHQVISEYNRDKKIKKRNKNNYNNSNKTELEIFDLHPECMHLLRLSCFDLGMC